MYKHAGYEPPTEIKALKGSSQIWNRERFGGIPQKKGELLQKIKELDEK